jgi:protein TonB
MALMKLGYWVSGGVHVAFFATMTLVEPPQKRTSRIVSVVMAAQEKKQTEEKPPEVKKAEPPREVRRQPLNPLPKAAAKPTAAEAQPVQLGPKTRLDAMPDFGISFSGASLGGDGMAVPVGPAGGSLEQPSGAGPAQKTVVRERVKEKVLGPSGAAPVQPGECSDTPTKPKPQGFVQPQYTDDARAAGIEGRVRVKLTIDASGTVTEASLVSGLGHGLDESALAAAKRMRFTPATECGKPVSSSFTITMRFVLGE